MSQTDSQSRERVALLYGLSAIALWSTVATGFKLGLEVLLDERDARPGVKFADAELIGIPHRLVISERNLANGEFEYQHRRDTESRNLKREEALNLLKEHAIN